MTVTVWRYIMFCAKKRPVWDETTDLGEIAPVITRTCSRRSFVRGSPRGGCPGRRTSAIAARTSASLDIWRTSADTSCARGGDLNLRIASRPRGLLRAMIRAVALSLAAVLLLAIVGCGGRLRQRRRRERRRSRSPTRLRRRRRRLGIRAIRRRPRRQRRPGRRSTRLPWPRSAGLSSPGTRRSTQPSATA